MSEVDGVVTSPRKIEANRRNAQKSTGPKTEAGKEIVAQNAITHGLHADPGNADAKSLGQMQRFVAALRDDLQPAGAMQELVFERIASLAWRLRRAQQSERKLLKQDRKWAIERFENNQEREPKPCKTIDPTHLHDTSLIAKQFASWGVAKNHYLMLRRYEASFERSLFKAINELEKLQEKSGAQSEK